MSNYRIGLSRYCRNLGKRKPSPGGGSAICAAFCIGVSLIEKALRYSGKKPLKLKKITSELIKLRLKINPYIDLDGKIFNEIMHKRGKKRMLMIKKSEAITLSLAKNVKKAFFLAKKAEFDIKDGIASDYYIGLAFLRLSLSGCVDNLKANSKMFSTKVKYLNCIKDSLRETDKSIRRIRRNG
ncbi:MAG: cyclodeaminase/cyclohydrolase family protein [Candidatus Omnitrophota bacterium]